VRSRQRSSRCGRGSVFTSRRRSYLASVGTGYAYTLAVGIANVALIAVLAQTEGPRGLGVWLTILTAGQWVLFAATWLGPAIVRRIGTHLARGETALAAKIVTNTRLVYAVAGTIVVAGAAGFALVSTATFDEISSKTVLAIVLYAVYIALQLQTQVSFNVLTAAQRLYVANFVQAGVVVASASLAAAALLAGFGIEGVAACYAAASAGGLVAARAAARRVLSAGFDRRAVSGREVRAAFRAAAPYSLSGMAWLMMSSDIVLVAALAGSEDAARYGVAYKLVESVLQIIWRVADTTQPYVIEAEAIADDQRLARLYRDTVSASLVLGLSAAASLYFLGDTVLTVWVGEDTAPADSVIRLLAVYVVLQAFVHASLVFPYATARMGPIARIQVVEGAAKVALALALGSQFGPAGVVVGSIAAIGLLSGWYVPAFTMRWLRVRASRFAAEVAARSTLTPLAAGFGALAASRLFDHDSLTALTASGIVTAAAFGGGALLNLVLLHRWRGV
jgi:O-antigen/teichoic acid export membrane protein